MAKKCAMLVLILMLPVLCVFGGKGTYSDIEEENACERTEEKACEKAEENACEKAGENAVETAEKEEKGQKEAGDGTEIKAAKGKLPSYSLTIHSGEEFAQMREWYDWHNLEPYRCVRVVFSEDLEEWQEEDLEALKILKCNVYVESSGETVPARALSYLTGATSLGFSDDSDMTDVSGIMPAGSRFPQQIKNVWLNAYREGKYRTLLQLLQDSQVETVMVYADLDAETEELQGFWLDDVAGIRTLKEAVLIDAAIRVRDQETLEDCGVRRIEGCVDQKTDVSFVERLSALEELTCDVREESDLQPLLEKKGLAFSLRFQEDCPAFYQAVSWPEDESGECTPHFYQRRYDQGRMAECFTGLRSGDSDVEIAMASGNPCLRVTDGAAVYEIRPGEAESNMQFMYVRAGGFRFQDINFDGTKDLVMAAVRYGAIGPAGTEFAYLWNQGTGRYEFSSSYRFIDNPEVDEEQQMIRGERSYWPDGYHNWTIYRYVDGEFAVQGSLTEEPLEADGIPEELEVPEGAEVIRWQEEIFENGEVVEEKNAYAVQIEGEETVIPKACENYYAQDSYWGGL